jgi:hypothetical protein
MAQFSFFEETCFLKVGAFIFVGEDKKKYYPVHHAPTGYLVTTVEKKKIAELIVKEFGDRPEFKDVFKLTLVEVLKLRKEIDQLICDKSGCT